MRRTLKTVRRAASTRRLRNSEEELDRNVEEEIARNLWVNHRMLPPDSKFKKWWNVAVVTLVMYNSIFIPFILGYNRYNPNNANLYYYDMERDDLVIHLLILDYLVDLVFIADIVLTFRTTFFDQDNELVLDKEIIARTYLRGSFPVDLLATLPFELLGLLYQGKLELGLKIFRLLRLTKVIRQLDVHNNVLRVTEMLVIFLVIAHLVGSLWWAIGVSPFNRNDDEVFGRPAGTSWVVRSSVCPAVESIHRSNYSSSVDMYCKDASMLQRVMSSLYWSLTTLIKTPWVHPDTIVEKAFASLIVVAGAIVFAAILGNITAMINSFDKSNAQLRDIMSTLHRLISKYEVSPKLQKRVFLYVQTQWSTTKGLDNQRILMKIPPALRGDILESIYADILQSSPIFAKVSHECVRVMLGKLRSEVCLAKESLLSAGQLCSEVYLLVRGVLQVQPAEEEVDLRGKPGFRVKVPFRTIETTGALVGMRDPFEKDCRFPFHVIAVKQAQLVSLSGKDLMEVFAMDNRNDIETICEVLDKEYYDIKTSLERGSGSPVRIRRASASQGRSSQGSGTSTSQPGPLSDHEEIQSRLSIVEDTLHMCDTEIHSIQQHLHLLPQLCELLSIPSMTDPAS